MAAGQDWVEVVAGIAPRDVPDCTDVSKAARMGVWQPGAEVKDLGKVGVGDQQAESFSQRISLFWSKAILLVYTLGDGDPRRVEVILACPQLGVSTGLNSTMT